jgi:hypothetical protein
MKEVKLTHAEVQTFYKSTDYIRTVEVPNKGTIINFNVKTRINDRVTNSPLIFEKCSFFSNSSEQLDRIKAMIKPGSILEITGIQNRSSYIDKKTQEKKYSDEVRVTDVVPTLVSEAPAKSREQDLPF